VQKQLGYKRFHRPALVGYSFGAEVLPFLVRRLPAEQKARVTQVVLLGVVLPGVVLPGPGKRAHFEFRLTDWLGSSGDGQDVQAEISRIAGIPILCVHGMQERASLCPALEAEVARNIALPGGHHFDGDYAGLARLILESPAPAEKPIRGQP